MVFFLVSYLSRLLDPVSQHWSVPKYSDSSIRQTLWLDELTIYIPAAILWIGICLVLIGCAILRSSNRGVR